MRTFCGISFVESYTFIVHCQALLCFVYPGIMGLFFVSLIVYEYFKLVWLIKSGGFD